MSSDRVGHCRQSWESCYEPWGRTRQDRVELNIKLRIGGCVGSSLTERREEWGESLHELQGLS